MNEKIRNIQIRVCVNKAEKDQIEETLKNVDSGSTSSFLRILGLCHEPKSIIDKNSIIALAKVNADQNRLGGLLKTLLSNNQRINPEVLKRTDALLDEIKEIQTKLLNAVNHL